MRHFAQTHSERLKLNWISSPLSLQTLPLLALETISEYVARSDPKRRSLFALSSTSRACCAATERERFERVHITLQSTEKLDEDLKRWNDLLGAGRKKYVRDLKISGQLDEVKTADENPWEEQKARLEKTLNVIAQFIATLSGFKDLIWHCSHQVPSSILAILHLKYPRSRLDVCTPRLIQQKNHPRNIESDEYGLVSSPCLHHIHGRYFAYRVDGQVNYNEEVVLRMAAGAAPNLTHVRICRTSYNGTELRNAYGTPRPEWQGFLGGNGRMSGDSQKPLNRRGRLTSLHFDGRVFPEQLQAWSNHISFPELHDFGIDWDTQWLRLDTLAKMARNDEFKALRRLTLSVWTARHAEDDQIDEAISLLISSLNPLQSLKLCMSENPGQKTFTAILQHGMILQVLDFTRYVVTRQNVQDLRGCYPNLREITLPIPRTIGDEHEVRLYRALGTFTRVETISLQLHCSPFNLREEYYKLATRDRPDKRLSFTLSPERVRKTLINAAVDRQLAHSIYRIISNAYAASST
ncbi:hypothetical protein BDV95DRAFT_595306 [Massariosphaeria phaeospora]|uniref:Uncharacterized protein n=1 Tax=Massariosphaeria phaeospora TaxID=100035 RepID=A0A7C8M771_9PLEO|nr:hypothetical protein BDV95DRAFT_595306 [Massariosphaeria phaeospora]